MVPNRTWYDPVLGATLSTGSHALDAAERLARTAGFTIATDIETPGLDRAFEINCVTFAWRWDDGSIHSVLLDPVGNTLHRQACIDLYERAETIILHNAPFDIPALRHAGLFGTSPNIAINKVVDTLLLARFALPDVTVSKSLTALSIRYLGLSDFKDGMKVAFAAAGYKTIQAGYEGMSIESPIYRVGAMADTIATLKLEPLLRAMAINWTLDHPFADHGATTDAEAEKILGDQETVHRVMLRRTGKGLAVDHEYLTRYQEEKDAERIQHEALLAAHGLEGGAGKGKKIVEYLAEIGQLPADWPRTPTGGLKATKDLLDGFDHPLTIAQRKLAEVDKVLGYLTKVERQAAVTGRCHPQVGVLGASATGRMAYSMPELQQFPKDARPIITDDGQGLTSIDWSQIEPVTMANMAGDVGFLIPFEAGEDLYEPIQRSCGLPMTKEGRDIAKVVLLATMYGMGVNGLALKIKHTVESAQQIRRQMLAAMPESAKWMARVQGIADQYGRIITAAGRILPVDDGGVFRAVNYTVQGSAYDVLASTIVRMEEAGLGDHLQLAMHDELIVDTEVSDEVQQIMLTPPDFLIRWAGRVPVLRTDAADMGRAWAKV
ncbi:DNA polymerase I [Mycobacterium phage SynergyX]|nr:DNA polymerase I [Mycobacterium phage SynergyX]